MNLRKALHLKYLNEAISCLIMCINAYIISCEPSKGTTTLMITLFYMKDLDKP